MRCEQGNVVGSGDGSDRLDGGEIKRLFDGSATAWLVGQGVRCLNRADKEAEFTYGRIVELLQRCDDLPQTIVDLMRAVPAGDAPLRWCLLHVLGDAGTVDAGDYLARAAIDPLPAPDPHGGCESARDAEMLVRTEAVHALRQIAARHRECADRLLKVVSERPEHPVLIEVVKAADDLGLRDRVREILPQEDHWILDIRRARAQELFADPERDDGKERGFTPPRGGALYTAPRTPCCNSK